MADSLLNTSISAIVTNATNKIPTATVDELVQIASAIDDIGKDEDSTLETAINSRINTLMGGSPTVTDVQKLGRVIRRMTDETVASQAGNTDNLTEGSTNLYHTSARAISAVTGSDLDMGGNKVQFGNMYATEADLPSASTYHGMFAHVHATGKAYFAHAGTWHKLIDENTSSINANIVGTVSGDILDTNGNVLLDNTHGTASFGGDVTGDLTGNVTGNVVGNTTGIHTGNVTGNIIGTVSGDILDTNGNVLLDNTHVTATFGGQSDTVASLSNLNSDDLSEGTTNLYYTDARVDSRISSQVTPFPYSAITQSLIPSVDSDGTTGVDLGSSSKKWRDLYLSGNTLHLGGAQITASAGTIKLPTGSVILDSGGSPQAIPSAIEELTNVDLVVPSENMTIAVDETDSGGSPTSGWEWSWNATSLPYARSTILNQTQGQIPLYKGSTYQVRNFAANVTSGNATQTHKIYLKWIDGAGLDNLVSWSTSLLSQTISFPGVRSGATVTGQVLNITVPSTITPPTLTPPTVTYNIGADTGVYQFSGANSGDNPSIGPIYKGGTYTFTLDSTVSGHPFYLTTDDGTNFVSNSFVGEYTSGVTGSRNSSGDVVFTVPADAPSTLYYQCGIHSAMKGTITIKDLAVETDADSNYVLYFQHTQEGHKNSVPIKPKPTIADQMCIVYNSTTSRFEPQDLMQYIDDTAQFKTKIEGLAVDQITAKINDNTLVGTSTLSTSIKNDVEFIANLNQQGDLQTFTGTARWYAPFDLQMTAVTGNLSTAADATVGLRINKNNAQTTTINILANQTSGTAALQTFTLSAGDYLTVDVLSIGTSTKGAGLVVQFKYKRV